MPRIKHMLRTYLRSRGLDIVRVAGVSDHSVLPAENLVDHLFSVGKEKFTALLVPVEDLTWDDGFSLDPAGWNPYLKTASEYLRGTATSYETSSLHAFYAAFSPATAAEYLATSLPGNGPLSLIPAGSYILPWSLVSPEERFLDRKRQNTEEELVASTPFSNRRNMRGLNKMGPVSYEKGRLEFSRLTRLVDSIRTKGYARSLGTDIEVVALRHRGELRYVVASGFHRSAVLAALGFRSIPVVLKPRLIVDSDLLLAGPAVRNGYWSREEVLAYLDFLFEERGLDRARALGLV